MLRSLRARLTYANVVATLALFLALAGGSAIALSGRNSVTTKDIAPGAVSTPKLARGAVTAAKIRNGSLHLSDFAAGELPAGSGVFSSRFSLKGGTMGFGPISGLGGTAAPLLSSVEMISSDTPLRAHDLAVQVTVPPGSGSRTFTLMVSEGETPISCMITAGETSCSSPAGTSVQIPAASAMAIEELSVGSPASADALVAFRVDQQ